MRTAWNWKQSRLTDIKWVAQLVSDPTRSNKSYCNSVSSSWDYRQLAYWLRRASDNESSSWTNCVPLTQGRRLSASCLSTFYTPNIRRHWSNNGCRVAGLWDCEMAQEKKTRCWAFDRVHNSRRRRPLDRLQYVCAIALSLETLGSFVFELSCGQTNRRPWSPYSRDSSAWVSN